jgi:ParB family chromosome partitioning protein
MTLQASSLAEHLRLVSTTSSVVAVPVGSIKPNPRQPRKHFDPQGIADLAESIRSQGLLQPLVVREVSRSNYELIAGERRLRACKEAGLLHVSVTVVTADSLEAALVENLQREDMTLSEQVAGVAELVSQRETGAAAAKAIGKTEQWVSKRICIANAPTVVLEFLNQGRTGDIEGLYELARLAAKDEALARAVIARYEDGTSLRALVRRAKNPPSAPHPPAASEPDGIPPGTKTHVVRELKICGSVLRVSTADGWVFLRFTKDMIRILTEQLSGPAKTPTH